MSTVVQKAGGILIHVVHGQPYIYMVHRHRYNDWSLPKGHIDEGESAEHAAIREIQEETGMLGRILMPLPPYQYQMPDGTTSDVAMFVCALEKVLGTLDASEVDHGKWVSIEEAIDLCSYPTQREYIDSVRHHIVSAAASITRY